MKKYLAIIFLLTFCFIGFEYLYFYTGHLYIPHGDAVEVVSTVSGETLYVDKGDGLEEFVVKGVNMGTDKPGYFSTELAIEKEEYLKWFKQIQAMGANAIRVYEVGPDDFYDAFYEYNENNPEPLYLMHGVWVDDYLANSSHSALEEEFFEPFLKDCRRMIDVVHGRHKANNERSLFAETYNKDISKWVCGYIFGADWESTLVAYTDKSFEQLPEYEGTYLRTEGASNFEIFLAQIGDLTIDYETKKYGEQRNIAFSNSASTDPLEYSEELKHYFEKSAAIDVEHIKQTKDFKAGQFASYHVYPFYPDYYSYLDVHDENTYLQYLKALENHHKIPVVISEFGVPTSRGRASIEEGSGRNQGAMNEKQQGEALISMYKDIMNAGCNGGMVFNWQDQWFKRSWNTMASVNLKSTPYWSDYQTTDQFFGLLAFDPGEKESICYVDGNVSEWGPEDVVQKQRDFELSMKYDEKFLYFMVQDEDFDLATKRLYIPIDTTYKSGARVAKNLDINMDRAADFVIEINGKDNSRVWVQEYYDLVGALFYDEISPQNFFSKEFPKKNSSTFTSIEMINKNRLYYEQYVDDELKASLLGVVAEEVGNQMLNEASSTDDTSREDRQILFSEYNPKNPLHYSLMSHYETGKLKYGNANPNAKNFDSMADFCVGEGVVEIKIPWQLLNFADPCNMYIHDDYYEHLGVEYLQIESMYVGVGDGQRVIKMESFGLDLLGKNPKYHERLKNSYYILKDYWTSL